MDIATQPGQPGRWLSPDPLDPATRSTPAVRNPTGRQPQGPLPGATEVGCVDWYLYPVNKMPRQTER